MHPAALGLIRGLALVLALVPAYFTPGAFILCIELDGHVALESALGGCNTPAGSPSGTGAALGGGDGCSPCFDLSLDSPVPTRGGSGVDLEFVVLPAVFPGGSEPDLLAAGRDRAVPTPAHTSQSFVLVLTPVLRC